LAAARGFDRTLFFALGGTLHYQATEPFFRQLVQFSFVWPVSNMGEGWYRIHDLLRRALGTLNETETKQAHAALEAYYRDRYNQGNEPATIAHAIYHANRQDWQRGFNEWNALFESAIQKSQYTLCENLRVLRGEMQLESDFSRGTVAYQIGCYATRLSHHDQASSALTEAIRFYNTDLQTRTDDVAAHKNLGIALQSLADLQANLSQHSEALENYRQSIASYDRALKWAPDRPGILRNRKITLQKLSDLQENNADKKGDQSHAS